jgi:hypothetical protein
MAFPTTGLLEAFAGTGTLDADWTTYPGANAPRRTSGQAGNNGASGAYVGAYWDVSTFGPDCEVYETVPVVADYIGLYARVGNLGGNPTGYQASWAGTSLTLQRNDSGGGQVELDSVTLSQTNGMQWGLECIGDQIKVYTNTGGGWVERLSATDATYGSAGYIAFDLYDVSAVTRLDDFSGGTVVGGAPEHERSAAISASTAVTVASREFFSVFERAAAIAATTAVTVANREFFSIFSRSAVLAATTGVAVADFERDLLRSASLSATGAITAQGEFWTIFERTVALVAASAVTVSGEFETPGSTVERSASLSAASAVTVASHQRDLLRQTSISATSAVEASGEHFTVHERSAAISATSGVAVADFEREHVRQVALGATSAIEVSGGVDGVAQRSASFDATSSVSATGQTVHIRSASFASTSQVAATGQRVGVHQRAAVLAAISAIQAQGIVNTTLERSVSIAATALITVGGAVNEPDLYPLDLTFREASSMAFAESGPVSFRERASITHRS